MVIGVKITLYNNQFNRMWDILIYIFVFTLAGIMLLLSPKNFDFIVRMFITGGVIATLVVLLARHLDKNDETMVILTDDEIEFKGIKSANDSYILSNFDRLYYHEGFFRSFVQLERDEGERPNWYRANGRPADEDRKKLEKLIEVANSRMKGK